MIVAGKVGCAVNGWYSCRSHAPARSSCFTLVSNHSGNNIVITGGTINATSESGAGIGNKAKSNNSGAGIGSGNGAGAGAGNGYEGVVDSIEITNGGTNGAGIGTGGSGTVGDISISGKVG